ncbi:MAG TPA: ATP synthase F1 subunit delta [Bacteroidota bacterium]|nr:ATP synthase F1 subunit delta [Bacteroidota bacterium]
MSQHRAAYRYALSLLEVAVDTRSLDAVGADLFMIDGLISASGEFIRFLRSPVVNTVKKRGILTLIFEGKVSPLTLKFLQLLAQRKRVAILPEIIARFFKLRDEQTGVLDVAARSTIPFSKDQESELTKRLSEATGKKISLRWRIDPALMGGFTIQYEDTVWDASVRRQLELLRERLTAPVS